MATSDIYHLQATRHVPPKPVDDSVPATGGFSALRQASRRGTRLSMSLENLGPC
jgi:hypothetical protein